MRLAHEADRPRVDDDQLRALTQTLFQLRGEHRMRLGRVRADDNDRVRLLDGVEGLRTGGFADRALQAVSGRRMAHARAGVHVVVAKGGAYQLLHEKGLFIGAARRRDAADRIACRTCAWKPLNSLAAWSMASSQRDLSPRVGDLRADHRRE